MRNDGPLGSTRGNGLHISFFSPLRPCAYRNGGGVDLIAVDPASGFGGRSALRQQHSPPAERHRDLPLEARVAKRSSAVHRGMHRVGEIRMPSV
jgi:hypothetical protein